MAAAALVWAAWAVLPGGGESAGGSDLDREAAELHGRWARGEMRPEMESASDLEVDRYLKAHAPFRVHCPPRSDVAFAVGGAGLHAVKGGGRTAYIVGRVGDAPVTILVLERGGLAAFPANEADVEGGRRRTGREGDYHLVSGVVAGNVVVVIGAAPPQALEGLLNAYGTHPDG